MIELTIRVGNPFILSWEVEIKNGATKPLILSWEIEVVIISKIPISFSVFNCTC